MNYFIYFHINKNIVSEGVFQNNVDVRSDNIVVLVFRVFLLKDWLQIKCLITMYLETKAFVSKMGNRAIKINFYVYFPANASWVNIIVRDAKFLTRHSLLSLFLLCLFRVSYSLKHCTEWIWEFAWKVWGGAKLQDKGRGVCYQCMYYQTKLLAL